MENPALRTAAHIELMDGVAFKIAVAASLSRAGAAILGLSDSGVNTRPVFFIKVSGIRREATVSAVLTNDDEATSVIIDFSGGDISKHDEYQCFTLAKGVPGTHDWSLGPNVVYDDLVVSPYFSELDLTAQLKRLEGDI